MENKNVKPHLFVTCEISSKPNAGFKPKERKTVELKLTDSLCERLDVFNASRNRTWRENGAAFSRSEMELSDYLNPILEQFVDFDVETQFVTWLRFVVEYK